MPSLAKSRKITIKISTKERNPFIKFRMGSFPLSMGRLGVTGEL